MYLPVSGIIRLDFYFYILRRSIFYPVYYLRPSILSPPYGRNSDPGSHSRLFSPPTHYGSCLTHYGSCLGFFLFLRDFSSSLVDSRRVVLTHARRSQQFVPLWSYHWAFDGWRFCCDGSSTFSVCVSSELALER